MKSLDKTPTRKATVFDIKFRENFINKTKKYKKQKKCN